MKHLRVQVDDPASYGRGQPVVHLYMDAMQSLRKMLKAAKQSPAELWLYPEEPKKDRGRITTAPEVHGMLWFEERPNPEESSFPLRFFVLDLGTEVIEHSHRYPGSMYKDLVRIFALPMASQLEEPRIGLRRWRQVRR